MRDLWVQKFLRKLVVGVAAPGDLAGSILVEILHSGEGGDVEQVARTSKYSPMLAITHLCLYTLHAHIVHIITCLILLVLNKYTCLDCLISCIVIIIYSLHA